MNMLISSITLDNIRLYIHQKINFDEIVIFTNIYILLNYITNMKIKYLKDLPATGLAALLLTAPVNA